MGVDFKNSIVGRLWAVIWKDVTRVDRFQYYILWFFMLAVPITLYSYGSYWFSTSVSEHLNSNAHRDSNECGFAIIRFLPLLFLFIIQIAVLITFFVNLEAMLRNFFNPEYEALKRYKQNIKNL